MSNAKLNNGELYTVPVGVTVHCANCSIKLEPGAECYIEDDSSSIYCLECIPKPKVTAPHRMAAQPLWMAYEARQEPRRVEQ